jgi:hypothetical protein
MTVVYEYDLGMESADPVPTIIPEVRTAHMQL